MKYKLSYKISHSEKGHERNTPFGATILNEKFKDAFNHQGSWVEALAIAETKVKAKVVELEQTKTIHLVSSKLRQKEEQE